MRSYQPLFLVRGNWVSNLVVCLYSQSVRDITKQKKAPPKRRRFKPF
jgi:hypothetical protein